MLCNWLGEHMVRAMCILLLFCWVIGRAVKSNPEGAGKVAGFFWDLLRRK